MDQGTVYLVLAGLFGLFMAWGIGANDVANAMATSVGSKSIKIWHAVVIAAVFEFAGAVLAGGEVTSTIRKGMIDSASVMQNPDLLIYGMLAALLAAGCWLLIATSRGWPVSTTHTIVGAIVGFAAVGIGIEAVKWGKVGTIVMSWVVSPVTAGVIAYVLFTSVQKLILEAADPVKNARRYIPIYMFMVGFVISLVTMFKGLKHVGLELTTSESYMWAASIGAICSIIGAISVQRLPKPVHTDMRSSFVTVERMFGVLMIATACAMAFAHGSNDVANAVGPVAAIVGVVNTGAVAQKSAMPLWVLLLGGTGIVLGLATYGRKVIATVGSNITDLTPSRGFAATLAAATTVVVASGTGLPISTTHTLVGAVLGVGIARGIAAIDLGVVRTIFMSWIITLPAGAGLAILFFYILKGIL